MITRTILVGLFALVLPASSAAAQAREPTRVVSEAKLKAMVANKPRSKAPLGARLGLVRRTGVATQKAAQAAPTSVREIIPASKKR